MNSAARPPLEYQDFYGLPEDERILLIGTRALHGAVDLALESDEISPGKIARYITKVTQKFIGVRHIETRPGPVKNVMFVRFGPTTKQMLGVQLMNRAPIIDQLEGQWEKIVAALVFKLAKDGVVLTMKDFEECTNSGRALLSHGHFDSIEFKMVTREEAKRLAEFDATKTGHA